MDDVEELKDQIAALEATLAGATGSVTAFEGELARMQESMVFTSREAGTLSTSIGGSLRNAFDGLVFEGMKLSDALTEVAQDILDTVYDVAMKPVQGALGGLLGNGLNGLLGGMMPFAKGGVLSQGRVTAFAKGGVVAEPTGFAMRGGRGLMGEAGPEAIMPLARGPDGRLGVQGGGGRSVSVVMNIQTPDVEGFRRSQSQVAAEASRAISRGQRNR
ncbi:phage tail tape measure protein [Neogemmobacter tilapiae]|uniref:Tail protein n=1 Tax=Neogemmobacter tilapiae TaxID=875041 RepID=A0A918WH65_9RHOB|nr:phage tail tape measure protein [Gemmobacter tilapiae]GHC46263.1 tail protein [Gemmobacter tilapiae]